MSDTLTIHWPYLFMAVAMLWFPRSWLRTGKRVLKKRRKPDDALERLAGVGAKDLENKSVQLGREFGNYRNYIDLCRAFAGSYCFGNYAFTVKDIESVNLWLIQFGVLVVATLVQSIRYDKKLSFFAPIFFFVGMAAGFSSEFTSFSSGDFTTFYAFALVLAINPIIPNPRWFLTTLGLFQLPLGFVFGSDLAMIGMTTVCILMPPMLSLLAKRPLVIFTRKARASASSRSGG